MAITDTGSSLKKVGGYLGIGTKRSPVNPKRMPDDFNDGLIIVEMVNGVEKKADQIILNGRFAPHIPFEFGGTQTLTKEFYPGNSEPSVQVLGSREKDTIVKGRFKTNKFSSETSELRQAAEEYQKLLDAMRLRGNLIRVTLGKWIRYGFLEETTFRLNTTQDIEYELKLFIVGFNPPTFDKSTKSDGNVNGPNKAVTSAAASMLSQATAPSTMRPTLASDITGMVSNVSEKVNLVTNFVGGTVESGQSTIGAANRAIGLIKNARSTISNTKRNLGALGFSNSIGTEGSSNPASNKVADLKNANYINSVQRTFSSLAALLAQLQATFTKLAASVPQFRHLVRQGDTLQKISIKYYQNADNWNRIYEHNKLRSTTLVVGTVLEIPKL